MDAEHSLRFYVMHVNTGRETDVCAALDRNGWDARVPRELREERRGGTWVQVERTLFPSYVFVQMAAMTNDAWRDTLAAARGCCPARYLGVHEPQAIAEDEAITIGLLAPDAHALPPSVVEFDAYGTPHIVSGPLLQLQSSVTRYLPRQRRAIVTLPLLHRARTLHMAITPVAKEDAHVDVAKVET